MSKKANSVGEQAWQLMLRKLIMVELYLRR